MGIKANKGVWRTNAIISVILLVGFAVTSYLSHKADYQASLDKIEQVSALSAEGIYYQLTAMFTKPVNISLTMAHDSLLLEHLSEEESLDEQEYIEKTSKYLNAYKEKYAFKSIFLVSCKTDRYYTDQGIDRVLEKGYVENNWYYNLLDSDQEYAISVDNDEVEGAENEIRVFVNCKVQDEEGNTMGIVGVGICIEELKVLLEEYENAYQLHTFLIGPDGTIEVSTEYTGYEKKDWFKTYGQESIRKDIFGWEENSESLEFWTDKIKDRSGKDFIASRYIPELNWHLIVQQNTGRILKEMRYRMYFLILLIALIILAVLTVVTLIIRRSNQWIQKLIEERQAVFVKATEHLYDNINEIDVTGNSYVGERTREYFESLGEKGLSYGAAVKSIAEKHVKKEFREGYIKTLLPENVIKEYEKGNDHLQYDFKLTENGSDYFWMRLNAHIFYLTEEDSIHMFLYQRNIDREKKKEKQAAIDQMTALYNRETTERLINKVLCRNPLGLCAFFILDIDNFKQANDLYGHAFGDYCIKSFADTMRSKFRTGDVLGRLGGDEFAAFMPETDEEAVKKKADEIRCALDTMCSDGTYSWKMSASIGVYIGQGTDFNMLYKNADAALYEAKKQGKNSYMVYDFEKK